MGPPVLSFQRAFPIRAGTALLLPAMSSNKGKLAFKVYVIPIHRPLAEDGISALWSHFMGAWSQDHFGLNLAQVLSRTRVLPDPIKGMATLGVLVDGDLLVARAQQNASCRVGADRFSQLAAQLHQSVVEGYHAEKRFLSI